MTEPRDEWVVAIQGVAAIVATEVEMGVPDDQVKSHLVGLFNRNGLSTRADLLAVAEAIRRHPQPPHDTAEEVERRRPIDELLGVTPPEDQLAAQMRARELVLELAAVVD